MKPKTKRRSNNLELTTGYAKRLIDGREGDIDKNIYPIHGFRRFTRKSSVLWIAAKNDNPFALWFLKRISDQINETTEFIKSKELEAEELFIDGLDIDYNAFSKKDVEKYPLNLKPPYSWIVARLIKRADDYFLTCLKLNSIGIISDKDRFSKIDKVSKSILSIINISVQYYEYEVTPQDVIDSSKIFIKATDKMGVIPPAILSGKLKADFLPPRSAA